MVKFIKKVIVVFLIVLVAGCAQTGRGTVRPSEDSDSTPGSANDAASMAVLGAIAVPVGLAALPFMALDSLRGEDIGLSELSLEEKYGPPTTVFACANDYFKLWHYHFQEGDNRDVYFFIFHDGYVQDVQTVNKWERLCVVSEPNVE